MSLLGDTQRKAALALEASLGPRAALSALRPLAFRSDPNEDSRLALAEWVRLADRADDRAAFDEGIAEWHRAGEVATMVSIVDQLRPQSACYLTEALASKFPTADVLFLAGKKARAAGRDALARERLSAALSGTTAGSLLRSQCAFALGEIGAQLRDEPIVKFLAHIDVRHLSNEQRPTFERFSLWSPSPYARATAIEALAHRGRTDVLLQHARRLHLHLARVEMDRLHAASKGNGPIAAKLKGTMDRIALAKGTPADAVGALRAIGRFDFTVDAWLAFSNGRELPRASSVDGTAVALLECIRERNEARMSDVLKLLSDVPPPQVTVLAWTALGLALSVSRVAKDALAVSSAWLRDDDTIVPARGYLWLGRCVSAAGGDAILAFQRAQWMREAGADEALRGELTRQAWMSRREGDVATALVLLRLAQGSVT